MPIIYVKDSSAINPIGSGNKLICHLVTDAMTWGGDFMNALSSKWDGPEINYKQHKEFVWGEVDFIRVESDIIVANMVALHGFYNELTKKSSMKYFILRRCLQACKDFAQKHNYSIHMPRIGDDSSGARWWMVRDIIEGVFSDMDIHVYNHDRYFNPYTKAITPL